MVAAKRHMQATQKISTVSSGVLDMHLQGAGGSSQETHAGNPKDIYCVEWCIGHASSGSWW